MVQSMQKKNRESKTTKGRAFKHTSVLGEAQVQCVGGEKAQLVFFNLEPTTLQEDPQCTGLSSHQGKQCTLSVLGPLGSRLESTFLDFFCFSFVFVCVCL